MSRWTRYFAAASAASMVALQAARLAGASPRTAGVLGLFGAVLPMVFGMAYLLLPAYVGRTLATRRLPGLHLVLAYGGAALLVAGTTGGSGALLALGAVAWSVGVLAFVLALSRTVGPALVADPEAVLRSADRPQRSTRVATAVLPVGVGYLLAGTVALLSAVGVLPNLVGASLPVAVHYYGAGFAALLVFALGARLLVGFFHVTPPRPLVWLVLACGGVAPALVAGSFWRPPWFRVGAGLELVAMAGYAVLVATVAYRTDRTRVGLYGIALGSGAGAAGVLAALALATGTAAGFPLGVHVTAILDGFFLLTIVGYAYQFFPVTTGQFAGATRRTALASVLALALGVAGSVAGAAGGSPLPRTVGTVLALAGTATYAYLLTRRLLGR